MKASLSRVAAELGAPRPAAEPEALQPAPADTTTASRPQPAGRIRAEPSAGRAAGPRGGSTTVTPGGFYRTTAYFTKEERAALRRLARDQDRPYAEIIREAVRSYLGIS